MQLDDILEQVRAQLTATAALADDRTRQIADALVTAATPAVRLAIINALSAAADEASAALLDYPGSPALSIAVDGDAVRVDVHASAPTEAPQAPRADENDTSARISLRLPESLKSDVEAAAAREGISVNSWLIRAANSALQPGWGGFAGGGFGATHFTSWADAAVRRAQNAHHVTGWING